LHRDYYPLAEAAQIADRSIEDLVYSAAFDKLQLFVIADNWSVGRIYGINQSTPEPIDLRPVFVGPAIPEFPSADDPEFFKKLSERQRIEEQCDQVVGRHTKYARLGAFKSIYDAPISGLNP